MASLTVEGMCERLAKEFDSEVVETFRTNKIDGSVFIELEESDMKELGIVALGDRKKLKKLIRTLQESQENTLRQDNPSDQIPGEMKDTCNPNYQEPVKATQHNGDAKQQGHHSGPVKEELLQTDFEVLTLDDVVLEIPNTSCDMPKGLKAPPGMSVTIVFHALAAVDAWQWDGTKSRAHIRFGHPDLGEWQVNCGEIAWSKDLDDFTLLQMVFLLPINKSLLDNKSPLPYSYVIYSGALASVKSPMEYLYGAPHQREEDFATRCLILSPHQLQCAQFDQYDTICYPGQPRSQMRADNLTQRFIKALKFSREPPASYSPESREVMVKRSLEKHLCDYRDDLTGDDTTVAMSVDKTVDEIMHIYDCLYHQLIFYTTSKKYASMPEINLGKDMQGWLLQTSRSLKVTPEQNIPPKKRLISAAIIILSLWKLGKDRFTRLPDRTMRTLLQIVTLRPSKSTQQCPDYENLCQHISFSRKAQLSEAVHTLCTTVMKYDATAVEWLQALPLYHFLKGYIQPFGALKLKNFMKQYFKKFYGETRKSIENAAKHTDSNAEEEFFDRFYEAVQHLLNADPFLVEVFVYICPTKDLSRLFLVILPYLSVIGVAKLVQDFLPVSPAQSATGYFKQIIDAVRVSVSMKEHGDSYRERRNYSEACGNVLTEVVAKLQSTYSHCVELVNAAVCLVLYGLLQLTQLQDADSGMEKQDVFHQLSFCLKNWISKNLSVSASLNPNLTRAKEEVKLWDQFLCSVDCPEELMQDWQKAVENLLKERIDQVDDEMKVNLVCVQELDSTHTHPCTMRSLESCAAHALESMDAVEGIKNAKKILSSGLMHADAVFKLLIERMFPEEKFLNLPELLKWRLWPCLISHFGSGFAEGVDENPRLMCGLAHLKVTVFHGKIQDGTISLDELKMIQGHKDVMKELLAAASLKKHMLDQRLKQLDYIQLYQKQLGRFELQHRKLENEGIASLKEDAATNLDPLELQKVINIDKPDYPPELLCLTATQPLKQYFEDFYTLTTEHSSDLFLSFWKGKLLEKTQAKRTALVVLMKHVWISTFEHCEAVLSNLQKQLTKTDEIEDYFGGKNMDDIHQEITKLFQGFNKCKNKTESDSWIKKTVERINIHKFLQQYSETAASMLKLKECLGLTGEFRNLNSLADKMSGAATNRRLKDIDQEAVEAGKSLETIAVDSGNLQCLQAFVECDTFITWLDKEFKDVSDLRNFVSVALATGVGGEDALALEKLSNLELVGSTFGPLIYDLRKDCELTDLFDTWGRVWKGAIKTARMKVILEDLSKEVEWFKEVKSGQGSVETTSYGQMDSLMKYGVYHIGSLETELLQSLQAIRVEICTSEEHGIPPTLLQRKSFSLEELRDLESRLVLMGGHSSTSPDGSSEITEKEKRKRANIEEFLKVFRQVCQVADVLVELHHEGHVKYIGWHHQCPCSSNLTNELQHLTEMKCELTAWKEEVAKQRQKFYELNYYTTLQLLYLRKELCEKSLLHSPNVLTLLLSISPDVQNSSVEEAIQYVAKNSLQPQDTSSDVSSTGHKGKYLDLSDLGLVLRKLGEQLQASIAKPREFPSEFLQSGSPNMLVTNPDDVLKTVVSLYMGDPFLPLPTMEEVLLCSDSTTAEEVILLWRRAVYDPGYKRIFCLVNAEKLSYNVADKAFRELTQIIQTATKEKERHEYRLVVVCGSETTQRSHVISKLEKYRRTYYKVLEADCSTYLRNHYCNPNDSCTSWSAAGISKSRVRIVKSKRGGVGKSLYIQRIAEMFPGKRYIIIPIHGPEVSPDVLIKLLGENFIGDISEIFHIDIAPSVLHKVDTVLFGILVLGGLSDSQGRVWRCNLSQKFAVEITEIGNGDKGVTTSFMKMLPTVECIPPKMHLETNSSAQAIAPLDTKEFHTPSFQRVYQYLKRYYKGDQKSVDEFVFQNIPEDTCHQCLDILMRFCGQKDPSWSEIRHFVHFLDQQMQLCEKSIYLILGGIEGFKSFVVKFMITMSKDFATSSLKCELARERQEQPHTSDPLLCYEIDERRQWEQNAHPYLFFNQDGQSMTFLGFKFSKTGDLLHPDTSAVLKHNVAAPELLEYLKLNKVNLDDQWKLWSKREMIDKLAIVMGLKDDLADPDKTYELTIDNVIKMLAIQMRFRSNIPVILMGETGCGKTRLIKYMCQLARQGQEIKNFFMLKVHGGTKDEDILNIIHKATAEAQKNIAIGVYTIVFFDEANTTESLELIKEIMCDHRENGRKIPASIKLVAACNPYRRHTDEMIQNLKSSGLGFQVDVERVQDRLGDIPLRELVYRVLDLPPSMRPLVYDFGQLNANAEKNYVRQIVHNHLVEMSIYPDGSEILTSIGTAISSVLCWCQQYMRQKKDECSFVSLRDVERAMIVYDYFYKKMHIFAPAIQRRQSRGWFRRSFFGGKRFPESQALILAISVCYHTRLRIREEFEKQLAKQLQDTKCKKLALSDGAKQFRDEVTWCQEVILDNMKIGRNIARNKALRENIFMMVVCIELRIPLFLVGKPGSSKSLSKTIVHDSMTGQASDSELMRDLKRVRMFSYQCSQLSTSESIIEVFKQAKDFQSKQNTDQFVSVVVLDEVGLAEDSPGLPLKALHPLLEDGTSGADDSDQVIPVKERVAFIGISNWALDPAKMNRGIMVTRTDPDTDELVLSARGICSNEENDPVREKLDEYFSPLAEAYQEVVETQDREFYGLRDFYSLIKMLYWMCEKSGQQLSDEELMYAIKRNFDGFGKFNTLSCFYQKLHIHGTLDTSQSDITLMEHSLKARDTTWHGENRYLLLLTENYAALTVLNVIHDSGSEMKPYVLFGSGFSRDREYTQVCCNISRIKLCMQTGRTVILLNLENLYESLYDVLNQYYTEHGGNRFVDLGLQCHRMKCQVHKNFKLILIAEEETVYQHFPTPLINRLEKHRIVMESILKPWQLNLLREFHLWITKFTAVSGSHGTKFKPEDAFVGYHKDIPATILFQAQKVFRSEIALSCPNKQDEPSEEEKRKVLKRSKYLILQTATPDALIRLPKTGISEEERQEITDYYFKSQQHSSLRDFLFQKIIVDEQKETIFMQVTTHSHLPSSVDYENIGRELDGMNISCLFLQEFDTELDYTNEISNIIRVSVDTESRQVKDSNSQKEKVSGQEVSQVHKRTLIVIQCDAAFADGSLIACARHRVYDTVSEEIKRTKHSDFRIYVLYIIHVPRRVVSFAFIGFQPKPWISCHIDSLLPSYGEIPLKLDQMQNSRLSQLFAMTSDRLHWLIPAATSKVQDSAHPNRSTMRLKILMSVIANQTNAAEKQTFCGALVSHIRIVLEQHDEHVYSENQWILNEALNPRQLHRGGTLQTALYGKLDDVVVPILAEIIAFTDRNYNLNLIVDSKLSKLWLDIFCNQEICSFKYKELFPERLGKQRQDVPGIGGRRCNTDFQCEFPYSWIIKQSLDGLLNQALQIAGGKVPVVDLHTQICRLIEQSPVGDILKQYSQSASSTVDLLANLYLHDFTKMSYTPKCIEEQEYSLLSQAINQAAQAMYKDTIISRLAAVHIAFFAAHKEVFWFGQLISVNPVILQPLISASTTEGSSDMVLHIMAVSEILKILDHTLPLKPSADGSLEKIHRWLQSVYACQRAVNSALDLPVNETQADKLSKSRAKWQRLQAVQFFIEHFITQQPNCDTHALNELLSSTKILNETLACSSDFTKVAAIEAIIKVLSSLKKLRRCKADWIQETSYAFFCEVVSNLSFGWTVPEDEVIQKLMSIAFPDGSSNPSYLAVEHNGILMIRQFLLHLLLKQDFKKCENYLAKYFESYHPPSQDILLQCIQGFEDSYHQQMSELPHAQKVQDTLRHVKEAYRTIVDLKSDRSRRALSSLRSVRAIARLRFSLSVVARTLCSLVENDCVDTSSLDDDSRILIQAVKDVCTDASINEVDTGPAVFLVKQIIRQYGSACFLALVKCQDYSWVLPERLSLPEEDKGVDPFVIYGKLYNNIRSGVFSAIRGVGFDRLSNSLKESQQKAVLLPLALFEKVTVMSQQIPEDISEKCKKFINEDSHIASKKMCIRLLKKNLPAASHLGATTPQQKILTEIVIHTVLALKMFHNVPILHPLVSLLKTPGSLKDCYLPTMPEDALSEVRKALPGVYYSKSLLHYMGVRQHFNTAAIFSMAACPRGHPYLITECGRPWVKGNCSECGLPIGGTDHNLRWFNKQLAAGHDNTRSGYILQKPSARSNAPISVRGLSPASCLIIRILMHSALLWASTIGEEARVREIQQLMRTSVKDRQIPDFFWNHLMCDIRLLHEAIGKSIDDAALLVHLILKSISNPQARAMVSIQLSSTEARAQWEDGFYTSCIQPVLQSLDQKLAIALDLLSADAKEDNDMLFVVVNERMSTGPKTLTHDVWSYRPQISLGHLKQTLQQANMQDQCPILNQFLHEEPSLRATKYLPEIVQLQYHLYDKYNYRMDQKVAQTTTVGQFLQDVKSSSDELWKSYHHMIFECLNKAWRLVREKLPQHGRLRVDEENLMSEVTLDTKLDYLIPTTIGHGICTTALVDYLVQTHNTFIERCQAIVHEKPKRKFDWKKLEVQITNINHCHLIDHEEQLYPIILSHCQHSLKAGHGQEVHYDFQGLEKHILKRFIFGKPTILLDIPQVAYQKDVYRSTTFQRVREVLHQVPLPSHIKGRLLRDTWNNQQLRKTTDVLEVALGFISSGAGSPKMSLCSFVQDALQMKLDSTIKLPDCSLEHTLSLWNVLSVQLSKTLTLAGEEPFDVERKDLLQELSEEQITNLNAALERFNLNQLLESLLEFTLIFAKYMSSDELQGWPIVATLEAFLANHGLPEIPNFDEKFPDDIVVGQAIAVWKRIVLFQKRSVTYTHTD